MKGKFKAGSVIRTEAFTYSVGKNGIAVRDPWQEFNVNGRTIRVQGWWMNGSANEYNAFGKRHLVVTGAGDDEANKMQRIAFKRTKAHTKASQKRHMQKGQAVAGQGANPAYAHPYGTAKQRPPANTFFVLDGLSRAEIGAILSAAVDQMGNKQTGVVDLVDPDGDGRVVNLDSDNNFSYYDAMTVSIKFSQNEYHIYHCHGPSGEENIEAD